MQGPELKWTDRCLYSGPATRGVPVIIETVIPDDVLMTTLLAGSTAPGLMRVLIDGEERWSASTGPDRDMAVTRYNGPLTLVIEVESDCKLACYGSVGRLPEPTVTA